jgi:hypothetical protein
MGRRRSSRTHAGRTSMIRSRATSALSSTLTPHRMARARSMCGEGGAGGEDLPNRRAGTEQLYVLSDHRGDRSPGGTVLRDAPERSRVLESRVLTPQTVGTR